jgi:hypothetical protein
MLIKTKRPFVRNPLFSGEKTEFIPCALFTRDPDRKFIPTPLRETKGEVNEQRNTVPSRKESGEYCERNQ